MASGDDIESEVTLDQMRAGITLPIGRSVVLKIDGLRRPNLQVHVELPDGSDFARNRPCVLEIAGEQAIRATTDATGKLSISLRNQAADDATLRLFDGAREVARWTFPIRPEDA